MKKLIQQICTSLADGQDLVLVTISSQSGSTPRLAGAKMIILRDGRISGDPEFLSRLPAIAGGAARPTGQPGQFEIHWPPR